MVLLEQWLSDQSFVNWAKQQSDIDIAKWEEYLNGDSRLWETAKVGKQILLGISFKEIQRNKEHSNNSLKSLLIKIDSSKIASSSKKKEKKDTKVFRIPQRWRIASSVASILIIASVAFFQFFHSSEVLYATGFGEQMEIELPDGTSVTLNANSKLAYNSKKSRVVQLEGEAFFEVVKKIETNENFQVITPDLAVTVLGTSFNVNARNDQTKVYLEEGIVELKIEDVEDEVIHMEPGDLVTYSKKDKKLKENRQNVSILENLSWKDGALIFNSKPLIDALYDIEDIYGIHFVLESNDLKEEEITGGVPIKDLEVTLETLNEVYGIQFRAEGKRYFLSKKGE